MSKIVHVLFVPTGTYRVEMERIGFRKNIVGSVNLSPGANQINGQLLVGTASETVMVTAAPSDLNTTASEVSSSAGKLAVANRAHALKRKPLKAALCVQSVTLTLKQVLPLVEAKPARR
jgi:hypothetical protein